MSIKKIVQEAINENPLKLKAAFEEEIEGRISLALEAKMKKMKEMDDEDEDDEDEDDKDEDDEELDEAKSPGLKYSVLDTNKVDIVATRLTKAAAEKKYGDKDNFVIGTESWIEDKYRDMKKSKA